MADTTEIVLQKLLTAKQRIQTAMDNAGENASGRTRASFRVEVDGYNYMLKGGNQNTAPIPTLEVGRPGGNVPGGMVQLANGKMDVSNKFKGILVRWAKDKGIIGAGDNGWGFATVVGRRIAAQGTKRHSAHVDIYSTIVKDTATDIRRTLSDVIAQTAKSKVETIATHF